MPTTLRNSRYPSLGKVTVTFDDSSTVSKTITSLGDTVFDSTTVRRAVKVEALSQTWLTASMPSPVTYPNSTVGIISNPEPGPQTHEWVIYMDIQA